MGFAFDLLVALKSFSDLNFQLNFICKAFLPDLAMGLGRIFLALALVAS